MNRIFAFSFFLLTSFLCFSQTNKFQKTYGGTGGEEAFNMSATSDGGFVFVGRTTSFGITKEDVYVAKVDIEGNLKWSKAIGGSANTNVEYGFSIQETSDMGYIICGSYQPNGSGNANFYILKLDSIGNKIWSKTFAGSQSQIGKSVVEMADGNYLAVGQTASFGTGIDDLYLIKISKTGNLISTTTIGGSQYDDALKIIKTKDNGYAIVGRTESYGEGQADVFLVKLDNTASVSWTKTYGGTTQDFGYNLFQTLDSGFAITGYTMSYTSGGRDILLMKTDKSGGFEWGKAYGGTANEEGFSVGQLSNGNYVITGFTSSFGAAGKNIALLKTDSSGNLLIFHALGGPSNETGVSLSTRGDNLWIFGQTSSFGSGSIDWFFVKVDPTDLTSGCNDSLITNALVVDAPFVTGTPTVPKSSGGTIATVSPTVSAVSTILKSICFSCNVATPIADFNFTVNDKTVSFTDVSQNSPASFSWNFGDSKTSTNQNPIHTFTSYSSYNVCLTVTNCIGNNQVCKTINIITGIKDLRTPEEFSINFNQGGEYIHITSASNATTKIIKLYTIEGKLLLENKYANLHDTKLDLKSFSNGVYIVSVVGSDGEMINKKIVKQ